MSDTQGTGWEKRESRESVSERHKKMMLNNNNNNNNNINTTATNNNNNMGLYYPGDTISYLVHTQK